MTQYVPSSAETVLYREWYAAVQASFVVLASGILYYDYLLTFVREVNWVWQGPRLFSWMNALFFLNRYATLFGHIGVLMRAFWPPGEDPQARVKICTELTLYHQYLSISIQFVVGVFMVLRVYALYNFDHRVLAFHLLCGLGAVGNGIASVLTTVELKYKTESFSVHAGCILQPGSHNSHRLAIAWLGVLGFEIVTFVFTLVRALKEPSLGKSVIMQLLLRDGTFYFAVMTVMSIGTVVSFLSQSPFASGSMSTLTNVVSSCLMTRLILNMRDPALSSRFIPATPVNGQVALTTVEWDVKGSGGLATTYDLAVTMGGTSVYSEADEGDDAYASKYHDKRYSYGSEESQKTTPDIV